MAQNYSNHTRYVPLFHMVGGTLILGILGGSIVNIIKAESSAKYSAALLVLVALVLLILFWYARWFALRAQDRAIRAEENFRHFILTGKPLDKSLRMSQVVALRFASDEEFPELAQRAAAENLSQQEIKKSIQQWRPDYNRV